MLKFKIHIFLLIEIFFFILSLYLFRINLWGSFALLILSALFLNFSLHITIHHFVHFNLKSKALNFVLSLLYTICLVFPYNIYKLQHINHHRYNNNINDITSTWKLKNNQLVPKNWFRYCFLWLFITPTKSFWKEAKEKDFAPNEMTLIKVELLILFSIYLLLFLINPFFVIWYALLFYFGWTFISITNYGQHLPIIKHTPTAFTFNNKIYNLLFFNNGLHLEHHNNAHLDYNELTPKMKNEILIPHLIAGLINLKQYEK